MIHVAKVFIALVVFLAVAELSKQYPKWGGLLSALPWITMLVLITSYQIDGTSPEILVRYLWATFWFILPTLLFVALMATMLSRGFAFYVAMISSTAAAGVANGIVAICLDASARSTQ
jgi:hypothetical protein